MSNELTELTEDEKQAKILETQMLLAQKDYIARKVAFELAAIIRQAYPEISMPNYEKYKDIEAQAQEFREIIDELQDS